MRRNSAKLGGATTIASTRGDLMAVDLGALASNDAKHDSASVAARRWRTGERAAEARGENSSGGG